MGDAAIGAVARVWDIPIAYARAGVSISYSHLLAELGHRFTRPKMRAVCKTLDAIDEAAIAAGEPSLPCWWYGVSSSDDGPWTGPAAVKLGREQQELAFAYWRDRKSS